jgi:hypothetical protein
MGMFDFLKGKKKNVKDGIDMAGSAVADKAGAHADKVEKATDMAKDAVDKLPD